VIVVDDASTDATCEIVEAYARQLQNVRLIRREGKRGLAGAITCGWEHTQADLLGVMDADLQHPADILPTLLSRIRDGADIAIASRYILPHSMDGWNPARKLLSRASVVASVPVQRSEIRVTDPLSGFFVVRRESISGLTFQQTGFKLLLEVLAKGRINLVSEIPFTFGIRTRDKSKANAMTGAQYALLLSKLLGTSIFRRQLSPIKGERSRALDVILGLLPLALGIQLIIWGLYLPSSLRGYADFRNCYTAGILVRTGHAHQIYNYALQKQIEDSYIGQTPALLPFVHLSYEAILFVPLSLLPYRAAYLCWLAVNVFLCLLCYACLKDKLSHASRAWRWLPSLLFLGFAPISAALMQGQDSIITLLLFAAALTFAEANNELVAGALIGFALYKFQLVLPIAFLFLVWRRWSSLLGLTLSSMAAVCLSVVISGWPQIAEYVGSLHQISTVFASGNVMLYHMPVAQMPTLRGAVSRIPYFSVRVVFDLVIFLSALTLAAAFWAGRKISLEWQLAIAVCATTLVGYHLLMHDLSILLLPLAVLISRGTVRSSWVVPVIWLSPALCWFGFHPLVTLSVVVFFCVLLSETRTNLIHRSAPVSLNFSSTTAGARP
jgi:dolichol-phosphate mannosyltransferase